jgi:hypothetical protein
MRRWQELWDLVQTWMQDRPEGFNPIFEGPADEPGSFPDIWFTADWHGQYLHEPCYVVRMLTDLPVVSFSFYHFACIMLLRYKPGPKFAIRNVGSSSDTDVRTQAFEIQVQLLIEIASNPRTRTRHMRSQ